MSNDSTLCRLFLKSMRAVMRRDDQAVSEQGWGITHTSDRRYWLVQDANGKTLWEGDAHCAYCARTNALTRTIPEVA